MCACRPSLGLVLVRPPDIALLTSRVSGPSSGELPPGKCNAKYTEVASFCSMGSGRLRFKQHHVSRGLALSEGKGPRAPQLPGVSERVHQASSGQPGGVRAEREQQVLSAGGGGPEGRSRGAFSGGFPISLLGVQGLGTPPEGRALAPAPPMQGLPLSWVSLLRESPVRVRRKEAVSLRAPVAEPRDTPAAGVLVSKSLFSSPCTPFLLSHSLDQLGSSP